MANKEELLHFLDRHVFDPILRASAKDYNHAEQSKLKDVQDRTISEKERFRGYRNAADVVTNYKRDLHSEAAKRVNQELEALKLPTLSSVKDEFLKVAEDQ